jgi:hypothetical protein
MLGLYARTHDSFSPSLKQQVAQWKDAGYSEADALDNVAYQKLAIKPKGKDVAALDERQKEHAGVLFASVISADQCQLTDPAKHKDDPGSVLEEFKGLGNEKLTALAEQIETNVPAEKRQALVVATWEALCKSPKQQ